MNNTKALTDVDTSTSFDNIFVNNSGTVRQINKATLFEALESAEDYQTLKSEVNTLQGTVNGIDTTTDTTLTKTGKAADAKITGDKLAALKEKDDAVDAEIGSLKESLADSKGKTEGIFNSIFLGKRINLFNNNECDYGNYIDSEGNVSKDPSNSFSITGYMKIRRNYTYAYKGLNTPGNLPYSAFYDKNRELLSAFKQKSGENILNNIPNDAVYVRFSIFNNDKNTFCMTAIDNNILHNIYNASVYSNFEQGVILINGSNADSKTRIRSDYISINEFKYVEVNDDNYEIFVRVYNENKVCIGTWNGSCLTQNNVEGVWTSYIPLNIIFDDYNNAYYFRLCIRKKR